MDNSLSIVIPAYNEEASIDKFLPELLIFCNKHNYSLIIVNDGSKDNTKSILDKYSDKVLTVIHHKVNKGYGGAIKTGIENSNSKYIITIDADGQHVIEEITKLHELIISSDADMIVGNRGLETKSYYRNIGKWIIRKIARVLMPLNIEDINSGMKIYDASLAKKYIKLCPDTMAYSDIILLTFINQRHLVIETPIQIKPRIAGESTIGINTAIDTVREILNIVILFNPMRIFLPVSLFFIIISLIWAAPILIEGRGVSVGAMLGLVCGILCFFIGLLAEQFSLIRKQIF